LGTSPNYKTGNKLTTAAGHLKNKTTNLLYENKQQQNYKNKPPPHQKQGAEKTRTSVAAAIHRANTGRSLAYDTTPPSCHNDLFKHFFRIFHRIIKNPTISRLP
jgi:hypothetical protein